MICVYTLLQDSTQNAKHRGAFQHNNVQGMIMHACFAPILQFSNIFGAQVCVCTGVIGVTVL
jgi:hypothetical protein